MGEFADRLGEMRVRVALPGDSLAAELTGSNTVTVSFSPASTDACPNRSWPGG